MIAIQELKLFEFDKKYFWKSRNISNSKTRILSFKGRKLFNEKLLLKNPCPNLGTKVEMILN